MIRVEVHAIRFVEFFAPLDERVGNLLGLRIGLTDDIVDVRKDGVGGAVILEMAEIYGAVCQKDRLIWRIEADRRTPNDVLDVDSESESYQYEKTSENPDQIR